jgi:hypothetical protein
MTDIPVTSAIKTAIITAFTITAALIWRDVIIHAISNFFPGEQLMYEVYAALIATLLLIVVIYLVFKTESEAKYVIYKLKHKNDEKKLVISKKKTKKK